MSGNVALDVVIGLVFVYLLYSLYATIIMEMISSFFGMRGRNLSYALRRMLMDERVYPHRIVKILGKEINIDILEQLARLVTSFIQVTGFEINLKNNKLYKEFFKQPSIKSLASGGLSEKPSYLTADNFSSGVINALKGDDDEGGALAAIQNGLEMLPEDSETRRHIETLLRTANNDLAKFKLLLERWFNDTMDRSTGWYKRSVQIILLAIASWLVITFNVDSLAIIKKLSNDPVTREQWVNSAISFQEENSEVINIARQNRDSSNMRELNIKLDSLAKIRDVLKNDILKSQSILSTSWHLPESLPAFDSWDPGKKLKDSVVVKHKSFDNKSTIFVVVHPSIDTAILHASLPERFKSDVKVIPVKTSRYKRSYVWAHLWGYALTVLALSLGAPFWFDLLNKLVKLRTSKSLPTDTGTPAASSGSGKLQSDSLNRVG